MITYSVEFKAISPITRIPDSQTIFGALCNEYKNMYGEEKLLALLKKETSEEPLFILSSMFLKDTLPIPFDFMPIHQQNELTIDDMLKFKQVKKIRYFSKKVFAKYQENKTEFNENFYRCFANEYKIVDQVLMCEDENITLSNRIKHDVRVRNNTNEEELFQDDVMYISDDTFFEVYIKFKEDNSPEVENLKNVFLNMKYVTIGGMKSVGYNMFSVHSTVLKKEESIASSTPSILISKAIGDENVNIEESFYKLYCDNAKFNAKKALYRQQTICFLEGSVLPTSKQFVGKVVVENDGQNDNYRNLLGFLL